MYNSARQGKGRIGCRPRMYQSHFGHRSRRQFHILPHSSQWRGPAVSPLDPFENPLHHNQSEITLTQHDADPLLFFPLLNVFGMGEGY
jgi:hypothetical protein